MMCLGVCFLGYNFFGKRGRERERETLIGCLPDAPQLGWNPQPFGVWDDAEPPGQARLFSQCEFTEEYNTCGQVHRSHIAQLAERDKVNVAVMAGNPA